LNNQSWGWSPIRIQIIIRKIIGTIVGAEAGTGTGAEAEAEAQIKKEVIAVY
jgi:hypothetical protein